MRLHVRKPAQVLDKSYARQVVFQKHMDAFRQALARLFSRVHEDEPEEYQQQLVLQFLSDTFYGQEKEYTISVKTGPGVVLQANTEEGHTIPISVRRVFAGEMMTTLKNNVKSLHELILYYFDRREQQPGSPISHLIITDVYNWYLFDELDFRRYFYENARLQKLYQLKKQQNRNDAFFFAETARILREMDDEVPVTCLNLREVAAMARKGETDSLPTLIAAYKLFSPEHLFAQPFAYNANTLHEPFYNELLHILGLREVLTKGTCRLERLREPDRQPGSLIEQIYTRLAITETPELSLTKSSKEPLSDRVMELAITWLSRLLVLKMAEAGRQRQYLTPRHIRSFGELDELFFSVASVPPGQRPIAIVSRYGPVPYINGSLLANTELEKQTFTIGSLDSSVEIPLWGNSILNLPDHDSERPAAVLPTWQYLLAMLDAYAFHPESLPGIQSDNKPVMDASRLGLVLEKLNGYRDNSSFTPAEVVMSVAGEAVRRAVLARFNTHFNWSATNLAELRDQLDRIPVATASAVLDDVRVVDPAVGSGHYLVAVLNELIALKASLGLLTDRKGHSLPRLTLLVANDELIATDENGETVHSDLVQETLAQERRRVVDHCLFGVDINPVAIQLSTARLWIELLKGCSAEELAANSPTMSLVTGDSLVSRFRTDFRIDTVRNPVLRDRFPAALAQYRQDGDRPVLTAFLEQVAWADRKDYAEIRQLEARLAQSALTFDFVANDVVIKATQEQLATKKTVFAGKERVFRNAFEWRFAFPALLNEAGHFTGFDIVIGQPPYQSIAADRFRRAWLRKTFSAVYSARLNAATLFAELGMRLVRPGGQLAFVLPAVDGESGSANDLPKATGLSPRTDQSVSPAETTTTQTGSFQWAIWPASNPFGTGAATHRKGSTSSI